MIAEAAITEALKLCLVDQQPLDPNSLINTEQSFTAFLYHLTTLFKPKNVFEWGPGHSTNIFLRADSDVKLFSIEAFKEWADLFSSQLIDKDPSWGSRFSIEVASVVSDEYYKTKFNDGFFDIVLMDGVDRGRCAVEAERITRPGGIILCHDTEIPGMLELVGGNLSKEKTTYFGDHVNVIKTSIWVRN